MRYCGAELVRFHGGLLQIFWIWNWSQMQSYNWELRWLCMV